MALVALSGCGGASDPAGSYEGTLTESGETSRTTADLQPGAAPSAETDHYNRSNADAVVSVRRVDPGHLELDLGGGCVVRVEHGDPQSAAAAVDPPHQTCHIAVEGFTGDVTLSGDAHLTHADPPSLDFSFYGSGSIGEPSRAGHVAVSHTIVFSGRHRAP
jgi:hypothetical protein